MSYTDFSDAKQNELEPIPDGTEVPVIFKVQAGDADLGDGCLKRSKSTDAIMLNLEATVTAGKYAKRKFFPNFYMGTKSGELSEKQQTGVDMARARLRAIVEASRGYAPADETPPAIAARKLKTLMDLNNMECSVIVGIEKGEGSFSDKNVIKRIVPHGKEGAATTNAKESAAIKQGAAANKQKSW